MVIQELKLLLKGAKSQKEKFEKKSEAFLMEFKEELTERLYQEIKADKNPWQTINSFAEEFGFEELECEKKDSIKIREKLLNISYCGENVEALCESKFISQLTPVLIAISESVCEYKGIHATKKAIYLRLAAPLEGLLASNAIDSNIR